MANREVTLFRFGPQDGLVGTQRTAISDGTSTFFSLEPGFYQTAIKITRFWDFSTLAFDDAGNVINTIRAVVPNEDGSTGYSNCTDFTDGGTAFGPVGLIPR